MADDTRVKGLSELQRFLDQLPVKLERNIMRGALRAGAKPILLDAKGRIHSVSGELAASLRISTRARGRTVTARIISSGTPTQPNKPIWVEYGTRPHLIGVDKSERPMINSQPWTKAGKFVRASMTTVNRMVMKIGARFVSGVRHPGARPKPFMRPAMDTQSGASVVAAGVYIRSRLTKEGLNASRIEIGQIGGGS